MAFKGRYSVGDNNDQHYNNHWRNQLYRPSNSTPFRRFSEHQPKPLMATRVPNPLIPTPSFRDQMETNRRNLLTEKGTDRFRGRQQQPRKGRRMINQDNDNHHYRSSPSPLPASPTSKRPLLKLPLLKTPLKKAPLLPTPVTFNKFPNTPPSLMSKLQVTIHSKGGDSGRKNPVKKNKGPWFCKTCNTSFTHFRSFRDHFKCETHKKKQEVMETLCSEKSKRIVARNFSNRKQPINSLTNPSTYTHYCFNCKIRFGGTVIEHRRTPEHKANKTVSKPFCDVCQYFLKSPSKFVRHCQSIRHRENIANRKSKKLGEVSRSEPEEEDCSSANSEQETNDSESQDEEELFTVDAVGIYESEADSANDQNFMDTTDEINDNDDNGIADINGIDICDDHEVPTERDLCSNENITNSPDETVNIDNVRVESEANIDSLDVKIETNGCIESDLKIGKSEETNQPILEVMQENNQTPYEVEDRGQNLDKVDDTNQNPNKVENTNQNLGEVDGMNQNLNEVEGTNQILDEVEEMKPTFEETTEPKIINLSDEENLRLFQSSSDIMNFIVPVVGFVCEICDQFFRDEKTAKEIHCRSEEHRENYQKLGDKIFKYDISKHRIIKAHSL